MDPWLSIDYVASSKTLLVIIAFLLYCIFISVYRLTLHPLASFPGPKLAAVTRLYEFYYDSICHGRFYREIERMHERYGPIVRINPFEIHINDPDYIKSLLNTNKELNKDPLRSRSLGQAQNVQETVEWAVHKRRRAPFDGFFSRKRIMELNGLVNAQADKLLNNMKTDAESSKRTCLSTYYRFASAETIFDYCFGRQFGFFEDQKTAEKLLIDQSRPGDFPGGHHLGRFTNHINLIISIQTFLYSLKLCLFGGEVAGQSFVALREWGVKRLEEVLGSAGDASDQDTVFSRLASSDLPAEERSFDYLLMQIFLFLRAGFDTTAYNLTLATYYVLTHPELKQRLELELETAECFNNGTPPSWNDLEKLPLLNAVIKETLRLGSGVLSRLSRQSPRTAMVYGDWVIPPTFPVSVSPPLIHNNSEIFPCPGSFNPDRWLHPSSGELDKYLLPFSKGSRSCLGQNLAMAELHIFLAAVFRAFDLELTDTVAEDVVSYYDDFTPTPRNGKQKLFVRAKLR